jgi:hypothetical protein
MILEWWMQEVEERMELDIFKVNGQMIAEISAAEVVIGSAQDALDLMADAGYQGAGGIICRAEHLAPLFFDLRSGLAGEILLKFSNYRMKLAVIGDFTQFDSQSLHAFIRESNRGRQIFFVPDRETAVRRLSGQS